MLELNFLYKNGKTSDYSRHISKFPDQAFMIFWNEYEHSHKFAETVRENLWFQSYSLVKVPEVGFFRPSDIFRNNLVIWPYQILLISGMRWRHIDMKYISVVKTACRKIARFQTSERAKNRQKMRLFGRFSKCCDQDFESFWEGFW